MLHNFDKIILFNNYTFYRDIITSSDGIKNIAKQFVHFTSGDEAPDTH
jgi:hypothetical protein